MVSAVGGAATGGNDVIGAAGGLASGCVGQITCSGETGQVSSGNIASGGGACGGMGRGSTAGLSGAGDGDSAPANSGAGGGGAYAVALGGGKAGGKDRKSTRLNSSH